MAIIAILTLFFASVLVFWFLDKTFSKKPLFTTQPKFKINYNFNRWEVLDYIALIVTASTSIFIVLALLITLDFKFPKAFAQTLFVIICSSTIVFAIIHYRIKEFYSAHTKLINILTAIATVIITLISNSIADSFIVGFTHVDPAQFPSAQKIFTFLGAIGIWLYIGMYACFFIYALVIANVFYSVVKSEKKQPSYVNSYTVQNGNNKKKLNRGFVMVLGVSYSVIIYLGFLGLIFSSAEIQLRKIFVFSSFHLTPEACDIATTIPDTKIALINDKQSVIAVPDTELIYTFTTKKCDIQPVKIERKNTTPIHYLKGFNQDFISSKNIGKTSCPIRYCSAFMSGPCI
ncbi:hypothetical protein [Pseudomonas putida]|uniref:hypothetical protein n=1 Tax=Pseudomonas putida TaxID=303 RepID=UPI001CD1F85A|nr:hypothetical protein [Pseudomonas putida]